MGWGTAAVQNKGGNGSMTQKERQARSKQEILQAAMAEFGSHNYADVTMEQICTQHHISKGMMYHYYANKDALFLLCVGETFRRLDEQIAHDMAEFAQQPIREQVRNFLLIREYFFQLHPHLKLIFENALFRTPKHLADDIRRLRRPLADRNHQFFERVVLQLPLRNNISTQEAMRYFEGMEYVFWELMVQFHPKEKPLDLHAFSVAVERLLDMILFGIVRQTTAKL